MQRGVVVLCCLCDPTLCQLLLAWCRSAVWRHQVMITRTHTVRPWDDQLCRRHSILHRSDTPPHWTSPVPPRVLMVCITCALMSDEKRLSCLQRWWCCHCDPSIKSALP